MHVAFLLSAKSYNITAAEAQRAELLVVLYEPLVCNSLQYDGEDTIHAIRFFGCLLQDGKGNE